TPRNCPRHDGPGLVPRDPQDRRSSLHRRLSQDVDRESLEEKREASMPLGPGKIDLADTVFRAAHSRWPGVKDRLELTAIEMTPGSLLAVIVQRRYTVA